MSGSRLESLRARAAPALAIAWKDLLLFRKGQTPWKGAVAALLALSPLLALAALMVHADGSWRGVERAVAFGVPGLLCAFSFTVTVPAAMSIALERDRDTLPALVVSPAAPRDLILGKLLAALANALGRKAIALPALAMVYALGGLDAGFLPRFLVVLFAADVSFASFALLMSSRTLRAPRLGSPGLRLGMSQAQLALKRGVGLSILGSLVPIYGSVFLLPFVIHQGLPLGRWLESGAAAGALHPLLALIAWGDAHLFGRAVPVWVLACALHLLLAVPLLASAAEGLRPPGAPRGRWTRVGVLLVLAFLLAVAAGSVWEAAPRVRGLVTGGIAAFVVVVSSMNASLAPPPRRPFGRSEVLRSLVDPTRAVASSAESAPGFALLLALLATPFVLACAPSAGEGLRTCFAFGLSSLGIAALGARLAAGAQGRDALAFERAAGAGRPSVAAAPEPREDGEPVEEPTSSATLVFSLGIVVLVFAPGLALLAQELARTSLPGLAPLLPALRGVATLAIAANPGIALAPLVEPGGFLASPRALGLLGVDLRFLEVLHDSLWALVGLVSIATLRRAPEVLPAKSAAPG